MKTVFLQSYSSHIKDLNALTMSNHVKYCDMNEYSLIVNNESYSPIIDFLYIKDLLKHYDRIFTLGSDVVMTNFSLSIDQFTDNSHYLTISRESRFSEYFGTPVNGEILIFNRKDDGIFKFVDILANIQNQLVSMKKFGFNDQDGIHYDFSTQALMCMIYKNNFNGSDILRQHIRFEEAGILQSYIQKYVDIRITESESWNKSKLLTHVFGIPNSRKIENIRKFFDEYPEYK